MDDITEMKSLLPMGDIPSNMSSINHMLSTSHSPKTNYHE